MGAKYDFLIEDKILLMHDTENQLERYFMHIIEMRNSIRPAANGESPLHTT